MDKKIMTKVMALWVGLVVVSTIAVMWGMAAIVPRFEPGASQTISNAEVEETAWVFGSILVLIAVFAAIPKLRRHAVRLTGLCCVLALAIAPVLYVVRAARADTTAQVAKYLSEAAGLCLLSLIILGAGLLFGFLRNRRGRGSHRDRESPHGDPLPHH